MERIETAEDLNVIARRAARLSKCMTDNQCMVGEVCYKKQNPTNCFLKLEGLKADLRQEGGGNVPKRDTALISQHTIDSSKDHR